MCPYSSMIYSPLDIYPVMGLLSQMVFLYLGPWGITTLSSTMVELIYTPTNSVKCSYFSTSSPASVVSRFFNNRHSNWREMVSHCSFDLHFFNDQWWWAFSHVCWPHIFLFLKRVCSYSLPTFEWGCLSFFFKSVLVHRRFWILALCQRGTLQNFLPILLVASSL